VKGAEVTLPNSQDVRRMTSIFDDIPRDDAGPPHQDETAFAYLNRSGRIEAQRVRELVDAWLGRYPGAQRDGLVARFRSAIDDQHRSAFFELFLHELVLTRGHKVIDIEPPLAHTTKSPDFLVECGQHGLRFYLEGVIATGRSQAEIAAQARLNQALSAIDKTSSPAHFLDLSVSGMPTAPVSINKMKNALERWIATLPVGDAVKGHAPFVYNEHGMRINLRAFPRHNRERAGRAIGVRHYPAQNVKTDDDIRAALEKKAKRYGALDHPYVVAVDAFGLFHHEEDALDALLGTPYVAMRQRHDGSTEADERRKPDGIWNGQQGPRRQGLSAVLSTEQVDPWNFGSRRARLIRNPWAGTPLPPVDLGVDELNPVNDGFCRVEGATMSSLFDLPARWPED
jgi:hypothetical protein